MKKGLFFGIVAALAVVAVLFGVLFAGGSNDMTGRIETLTADNADKAAQIETLTAENAGREAQIEPLTADVADKDVQLGSLTADAAEKDAQIGDLTGDVEGKAARIEELTAEISGQDAQITELTATVTDGKAQISELTAQAEAKDAEIAELQSKVDALTAEAAALNGGTAPLTADTLLCTINGREITYGDVEPYIQQVISTYVDQYGMSADDPELVAYSKPYAMYQAQQYAILDGIGEELNVVFTDADAEEIRVQTAAAWEEIIAYYAASYFGITDESTDEEKTAARDGVLALLASVGYTEESVLQAELDNARLNKILMEICKDVTVTDSEVDARINALIEADKENCGNDVSYYEMMQYYGYTVRYIPEGYRAVTHILLKVDETLMNTYSDLKTRFEAQQEDASAEAGDEAVTAEQVEAARQAILNSVQPTVDEIMEKFNAGTSFADLIAEYGTDPGMQQEGATETGYNVAATSIMWDIPFRDGAMSIEKIGDVSEPVVGTNGVHIIYYLKDIPGGPVEVTAEEREQIRNEMLTERQNELISACINERMAVATVVYTEAGEPFAVPEATEEETAAEAE